MEIFFCKLAQAGFCTSDSITLPTGASQLSNEIRICQQPASDNKANIKCDKKVLASDTIIPTQDEIDGSL